jgi:hypothetical protein
MDILTKDMAMHSLHLAQHNGNYCNDSTIQTYRMLTDLTEESNPEDSEQMATNLKLRLRIGSFIELAQVIKYSGFLKIVEVCNGPLKPHMRGAVELRWSNLLKEEFNNWISHQVSEESKKSQWDKAHLQVRFLDYGAA